MASVVERQAAGGGNERDRRRLYVTFRARDRKTGERKKIWVLQSSTLKTKANDRVREIERALRENGGWWPIEEEQEAPITVDEYAQTWLKEHERTVSARTLDGYTRSFRLYISPRFGAMPVAEVRRRDIKELVGELVDAGLSRNSIRNIVTAARAMFREAVRDELIAANPAADVEIPEGAPVRPTAVPTREQLDEVIKAARSDDTRDAIVLMATLALRRGECFALRWADIDFEAGLVHVRATNHRGRISERTKTQAGTRLVPLFASARAALEARRDWLDATPHPTAFVFPSVIGGPLDPGNWARREWLPALKAAGYEKRFHVHELRHFGATALDEQGMVGKLRSEIVGHANEEITNSIYTTIRRERVAAAAADFDPLRKTRG